MPVSELAKQRMLCLNMYRIMLYVCKKLLWPDWYGSGFDLSSTIVESERALGCRNMMHRGGSTSTKVSFPQSCNYKQTKAQQALASMLLPLQLLKKLFQKLLASMLLLLQLLLSLLNIP